MKTIRNIFRCAAVAAAMLSSFSCKDYLTTAPADQVPAGKVVEKVSQLEMVLVSAYKQMFFNSSGSSDRVFAGIPGMEMWYDLRGEDMMSHTNMGGNQVDSYSFTPSMTMASGSSKVMWNFCYLLINQCNIITDYVDGATGTDEGKTVVKGQAEAMRALAYFHLIMNYQQTYTLAKEKRGVILRLKSDDSEDMGFSTVQQVYDQILSDLNDAAVKLKDYDRGDEVWRINADVVNGLLARVHQVMGDWKAAYDCANAAYSNHRTLMSKKQWYGGFDDCITEGIEEVFWAMKYTDQNNIGGSCQHNFWFNQDPSYGEDQDGPIYRFFDFFVTPAYVALFDGDPDDWRGFKVPYDTPHVKDSLEKAAMFWRRTENGKAEWNSKWAYNKWKHYGDNSGATRPEVPLMRSSEMLLIMAEAKANLGETGEALNLLNTMRAARNSKACTVSARDALLEEIYRERRKELLGEGVTGQYDLLRLRRGMIRYMDVKSNPAGHYYWGCQYLDEYDPKDSISAHGKLKSNDYRFIFQIPDDEISNNKAISEADQNPFSGGGED